MPHLPAGRACVPPARPPSARRLDCRQRRGLSLLTLLVGLAHLGAWQTGVPAPASRPDAAAIYRVVLRPAPPGPAEPPLPPAARPDSEPAQATLPATDVPAPAPRQPTPPRRHAPAPPVAAQQPTPAAAAAPAENPPAAGTPLQLALAGGEHGPARSETAASAPPPTRLPPTGALLYRVQRGLLNGEGRLDWQHAAGHYQLQLEARVPLLGSIFSQSSAGGFDAAGVAPLRHTEKRLRRSEQALSFVRQGGAAHIAFSSKTETLPLPAGAQDRVSWMVQLPALLEGESGPIQPGWQRHLLVANVQGELQDWHFVVTEAPPHGQSGLIKLIREAGGQFETRAEVWADPQRHHWLVRVRLSEGRSDPLELVAQPEGGSD